MTYIASFNEIKQKKIGENNGRPIYINVLVSTCVECGEKFEQQISRFPEEICKRCREGFKTNEGMKLKDIDELWKKFED